MRFVATKGRDFGRCSPPYTRMVLTLMRAAGDEVVDDTAA